MKITHLTLITGADIFLKEFLVKIHQPTLEEIAILSEERFFYALNAFVIDRNKIREGLQAKLDSEQLKTFLEESDELSILIQFLNADEQLKESFLDLVNLLLKDTKLIISRGKLVIVDKENQLLFEMDNKFYLELKSIVTQIFELDKLTGSTSFNPKGKLAEEIASKMQKARAKVAQQSNDKDAPSVLSHYASVLAIGANSLNLNDIKQLTLYQLYNQMERFELYDKYKATFRAALVGSKQEIVNWYKQI